MDRNDILDKLELAAENNIRHHDDNFHTDCKTCHMYCDCKFYEQKVGHSLCEVVIHPYFDNPHKGGEK